MDGFVFAGGGSGGHLFPAIAVARELRQRLPNAVIVFAAGARAVEGHILDGEGFHRRVISSAASSDLKRNPLRFAWRHWTGLRDALRWLDNLRPRAVIGCGGYASVPVAMAATRLGIPLVLLEQNVVPGRATSWLARRACVVCTSFAESSACLPRGTNIILTGNPVRAEIAALSNHTSDSAGRIRTLLVLGGSQGAAAVNARVLDFVAQRTGFLSGWRIIHQTGAQEKRSVRERYTALSIDADVHAFIDDMPAAYSTADLVVSRAGATTLAELACAGLPAVLMPYPGAVRDHQRRNAEVYRSAGAAVVASEDSTTDLAAALQWLLTKWADRRQLSVAMARLARPDATQRVVEAVLTASGGVQPHCPAGA